MAPFDERLGDAFQVANRDALLDETLENIGNLLKRQYALDLFNKLRCFLFHVVEEKPRLLKREELVSVTAENAGKVIGKHSAKVERPHTGLVKPLLVLGLHPAGIVSRKERLSGLELYTRSRQVLRVLHCEHKTLAQHTLGDRHLVHKKAVTAILHGRIE